MAGSNSPQHGVPLAPQRSPDSKNFNPNDGPASPNPNPDVDPAVLHIPNLES